MTPEAQRIAIGKVCPRAVRKTVTVICGHGFDEDEIILNPLTDLNAIHEAVMSRDNDERWAIFARLAHIVPAELPAACATAAQWSEAFLQVIGKWDDAA